MKNDNLELPAYFGLTILFVGLSLVIGFVIYIIAPQKDPDEHTLWYDILMIALLSGRILHSNNLFKISKDEIQIHFIFNIFKRKKVIRTKDIKKIIIDNPKNMTDAKFVFVLKDNTEIPIYSQLLGVRGTKK